jgi:uncharacterized oligopeptide transporter (OPT) family protein
MSDPNHPGSAPGPDGAPGSGPGDGAAVRPLPPFDGDGPPLGKREPESFAADLFQTRYPEVTITALVFAVLIGIVMNAAITYAGLKIGFTLTGSAIAAVLGFGVLRGVLRRGTILETNIAQTVASAVNTSNSGIIFTVPVLFLLGYTLSWKETDFWLVTLACIGGGVMGAAFIVPLRKQMLDIERLRFPSSTGVAMILKSPGAGTAKAIVLLAGMLLGALIYLPAGLPDLPARAADVAELDDLFERGVITHETREFTRTLDGWIDSAGAPALVTAAGQAAVALDEVRTRVADGELDPGNVADAATIAAAESRAGAALTAAGGDHPELTEDLALAIGRAAAGDAAWDELRDPRLGWAGKPWFGYGDLDVRLPATAAAEPPAEAADLDGDGQPDTELAVRVDRDQDGRPDRLITNTAIDLGRMIGLPDQFQLIFAIAPFALGAGYITGRAGLFVLAGGLLAFFVLNPISYGMGWTPATVAAHEAPDFLFGAVNRPLGIGLLLGGALMGVLFSLPAIKEALKSIASAGSLKGGSDELSMKPLVVTAALGMVFLFVATDVVGDKAINAACPVTQQIVGAGTVPAAAKEADAGTADEGSIVNVRYAGYSIAVAGPEAERTWESWTDEQRDDWLTTINARRGLLAGLPKHLRAAIVALVGGIWIWFAGIIIAQCTGMTDWSPISGMALLTVVLVMILAGTGAVVGAVLIGATLCVAITLAADMMGDLKTGYLVGAKPRRQQTVEMVAVAIGPVICMLTLTLIAAVNMKQTGIAMGPGTPTTAPQAQALQAVITGVQGGEMPYALYGFGALLGGLLGLGSFAGLGVLVGLSMYLPFIYISTYGIGCLLNMLVSKVKGRSWAEEWGVPMAAGLIVGESLLQLSINIIVLAAG